MGTYCDTVSAAGLAAASTDTFAAIGTVRLRPGPGTILGFIMNHAPNANTAAEAYQGQFQFDLGQVGLTEAILTGPCSVGEAVATQSSGHAGAASIRGVRIPFKGNEDIPISFAHHGPAPTAGTNAQAAILYSQPPHPPEEWFQRFPYLYPLSGSDSEANAAVTAAATAITALDIPAHARHVCGFACTAAQDAAGRTAEDLVLTLDYASTIPDFTPQEYPFVWKYPNLAGTLVGQGIAFPTVTMPAWIDTKGQNQTITPTTRLATAVTDAHSVTADAIYTNQ